MVKIQLSFVIDVVSMSWHSDIQVAKGLVGHTHILVGSHGHHLVVSEPFRLFISALKDKLTHFRQRLFCLWMDYLVGLSCPDGLFVQLDMFYGWGAKHHSSHHTIADGQCLCPGHCRLIIPELILVGYELE